MNEPLIWTARGNVPIASLRYEHEWIDTPDEVTFHERWFAEDGELVKNNCHKLAKKQMSIGGAQATMQ
jgi:hypothetical protein